MNNQFNYQQNARVIEQRGTSIVQTNKVLRNTYLLLSLTLIFSAVTAGWSMMIAAPVLNPFLTLFIYLGLLFGVQMTRNSPMGLVLTFALTGFLGWTLGPILNFYITSFSNGSELIMIALGSTGAIFLGLSAIALNPKRDFSRLGSFLGIGALIALVAIIVNLFLQMPALYLALSVIIAFISGGLILWQTNQIVRGGETNYIVATVTIYVSILNIFLTILQFLGIFSGNRN